MRNISTKRSKNEVQEGRVATCLEVLGNKWTALILTNLLDGPLRFTALEQSLDGISPRTLSQRLDDLEAHGVITKKTFHEVPPRVEYTLTPKGRDFIPILNQMAAWGSKYPSK